MTLKQWERESSRRTGHHFVGEMYRIVESNEENQERSKWGGTKTRNFDRKLCLLCKRKVSTQLFASEIILTA